MIKLNRPQLPFQDVAHRVVYWYNKSARSWCVQVKDIYGNQIGDATYVGSQDEALTQARIEARDKNLKICKE